MDKFLEDKIVEVTTTEQNKEKTMKRDLWDIIKCTYIQIIGSQKKKRKVNGLRKYLKRL